MMLMATLDGRLTSRLVFVDTQTTTAAEFCLFLLVVSPRNQKTIVIFGTCMSTTLLLAIHNDIIPKTNGTDAGGASSWQHFAGMQKTDCIPIEPTFSRLMGRQEYRLAWALVCHMNRLDHGITYTAYTYHITLTTRTTYHIQTSRHRQRRGTIRNED